MERVCPNCKCRNFEKKYLGYYIPDVGWCEVALVHPRKNKGRMKMTTVAAYVCTICGNTSLYKEGDEVDDQDPTIRYRSYR